MTCLFMGIGLVNAQTQKVTGTVISDENGLPVIGATIQVEGTESIGTITDMDGKFVLENIPSSAKNLVVSFIGMEKQTIAIKPTVSVVLVADAEVLDEVMIVAYGQTTKASFTGSASTVAANQVLKDVPVASFEEVLQGSAPGITVNTVSGQPGSALQIRLRGTGSMNAGNAPLYVIDGIPVVSGDIAISGVSDDSKSFNILSSLNPSDIENITILKDAAAASLYGSRAANGVVMITTKRGKEGKTSFSFKSSWGYSDWATKNRQIVNGDQQRELVYEAHYNEAILYEGASEEEAAAYAEAYTDYWAPKLEEYSNWEEALFNNNASNSSYEFAAQGGNAKTNFYASLAYKDEQGMTEASWLKGFYGRANINHESNDGKMKMGVNIAMSKQESSQTSEGYAYTNPFFVSRWYAIPNIPIYNEDGSYYEGFPINVLGVANPVKDNNLDKNLSDVMRSTNAVWASYEIVKGLTIKETLSYDYIMNEATTHWPKASNNGNLHDGFMIKIANQTHNIYSSTILNYAKKFGKHNFDALLGWDVDKKKDTYIQAVGSGYSTDLLPELENSANPMGASSGFSDDRLLSFLSRVNYDYGDKYYASANFRRDGSSRLGANKRWGNFWSASGAWRISSEDFMKDITWLDDLKFRASYGVSGTLPAYLYEHLSLVGTGYDYMDAPGMAPTTIPNPDLAWEKNKNFNIGFDTRLFDRVNLTFDFYNRITTDLLQSVPTSMTVGFTSALKNVGSMQNRGFEADLSVEILKHTDVKWTTGLALAHNKNQIVELYDGKDIISGSRILREGESYYSWWSREWAGVDPETGEEQWVLNTENEDGSLNKELTKDPSKAQRVIVGTPDPKLTGGWRNTLSWKGFDLNALFSFSLGGKLMDDGALLYTDTDGENPYYAIGIQQLDRWQKPGDITDVPRRINGYIYARYGSDRHMHTNNYLRLKSVSLSYTMPKSWTRKVDVEGLRFFASGNNLLTFQSYDNVDPEQPISGVVEFAFPALKSISFGLELTF